MGLDFSRLAWHQCRRVVNLGIDAKHHAARIRLLLFFSDFGAGGNVIVDSLVKRLLQCILAVGMKAHVVADACDLSRQDAVLVVIEDTGSVAFLGQVFVMA